MLLEVETRLRLVRDEEEACLFHCREEAVLHLPEQADAFLEADNIVVLEIMKHEFFHSLALVWCGNEWLEADGHQAYVEGQYAHGVLDDGNSRL